MKKTIDMLKTTRGLIETVTRPVDEAERLRIPDGFNNHLHWHVGHLVVTQQLLCYKMASAEMFIDDSLVALFRKGTSPRDWPADAEVPSYDALISLLHAMAERLGGDYDGGHFGEFHTYKTSAGVTLESVDDAIAFNNYHEGIHLGYILALRRALGISA